jgi:hypothetical protein
MNYDEMSNHNLNKLIDEYLTSEGLNNLEVFDLLNPADWANLITVIIADPAKGVKIQDTGVIISDYGDFNLKDIEVTESNIGRAISICYLKMKEANNG